MYADSWSSGYEFQFFLFFVFCFHVSGMLVRVVWWWTRTYQDVFAPRVGVVFDVEPDEVLGEFTV
jgi:hypothetical protein